MLFVYNFHIFIRMIEVTENIENCKVTQNCNSQQAHNTHGDCVTVH